jgi:hypothetical protein
VSISVANDDGGDAVADIVEGEFVELSPSHIYTWYAPDLHAIKVGMGRDADSRMTDYASGYGIKCSHLHTIPVPDILNVRTIEARCHAALRTSGLVVLPGAIREVFALGTKMTYEAAVEIVETVVNEALVDGAVALANNKKVQLSYKQRQQREQAAEQARRQAAEAEAERERVANEQAVLERAAQAQFRQDLIQQAKLEEYLWGQFFSIRYARRGHWFANTLMIGIGTVLVSPVIEADVGLTKRKMRKQTGVTYADMQARWEAFDDDMRARLKRAHRTYFPASAHEKEQLFRTLAERTLRTAAAEAD